MLEQTAEESLSESYREVIGPNRQDYYLDRFEAFDRAGKAHATWHWPALFVPVPWLAYRKLWWQIPLYIVAVLAFGFLLGLVVGLLARVMGLGLSRATLVLIVQILATIIPLVLSALYANAIYYWHCRRLIAKAGAGKPGTAPASASKRLDELSRRGGTSKVAVWVLVVVLPVAMMGIIAMLALPGYNMYATRAHLIEAIVAADMPRLDIDEYRLEHSRFPATLEEAGFNQPLPAAVSAMRIEGDDGTLVVTVADGKFAGKTISFKSVYDADGISVGRRCWSVDIPPEYLPAACRKPPG